MRKFAEDFKAEVNMETSNNQNIEQDIARQRRNLVVLSTGLLVFELGKGTIKNLYIFGGGIELQNPNVAICFAYIALAYFFWRFRQYILPKQYKFSKDVENFFSELPCYKKLVEKHLKYFEEKSGVASDKGYHGDVEDGEEKKLSPEPEVKIIKGFFSRKLNIKIENPRGDYVDKKNNSLNFFRCELCWTNAVFKVILNSRSFSDYRLPYILAIGAFVVGIVRLVWAG